MKAFNDKNHTIKKSIISNITDILVKIIDTNEGKCKQDEKTTYISAKLSNYEYSLEKKRIKNTTTAFETPGQG